MSEKDRDEIAGMLTKKQIEDLGAPWLSMAEAPAPTNYGIAPAMTPPPYVSPPSTYGADNNSPLALEGYGQASGPLNRKQLDKSGAMRLRYGRSF